MLTGVSGTSRNGTLHNYYSCNGKKKHGCKRKNIQKDYIEDIVVKEAKEILTDELIEIIADNISKLAKKEKNTSYIKQLESRLKESKKQKDNLLDSLKICEIDSVKQTIFAEIAKMEEQQKEFETQIIIENSKHVDFNKQEIKFFLTQMKNLDTDIVDNKKLLINVLIDSVYIYDDELTIVFNVTKNKTKTIKKPSIEEINGSFLGNQGAPRQHYTNIYYFVGGFAIRVMI